jgi:hypothetical protein
VVGDDFEELVWCLGVLDEQGDEGFVDGWFLGFLVAEQKGELWCQSEGIRCLRLLSIDKV